MMSSQESWHLVDECVISPLHSSLEVTPEDSVSRVSQVDSGRSRALSSSTTSSSSSKRRRDAKIKAAIANLQAKQLAERVKRDNEVREQEFQEEMAQKGIRVETGMSKARTRPTAKEKRRRNGCDFRPKSS